jgi:6-phosphofructo-2-kinase/fructose-2,6-biphosphatase 2
MELARPNRKTNGAGIQVEDTQICVVMVGLPARGKSLIAQKGSPPIGLLYLDWQICN